MKINIYFKVIALFVFGALRTQCYAQSPTVVQSADFSYSLKLTELSFSGIGVVPIRDDNNTRFYDSPHWTTSEEKPVCFVSGTKPQINCSFEIDGICTNNLYIRGKASNGMEFIQKQVIIQSNIVTYPLTEANSGFEANKADLLENFSIVWEMSNNPNGQWVSIGTSKNIMYVVKSSPKEIYSKYQTKMSKRMGDFQYPTYRTILHIGCEQGKGQTTDAMMVEKIYNYFKNKNVQSIDNNYCMQYWGNQYGNGYTQPLIPHDIYYSLFTSSGLIQYGEGTCNAWAVFFVEIMRTQGNDQLSLMVVRWKSNEFFDYQASTELASALSLHNYARNPFGPSQLQAAFFVKKWAVSSPFVMVDKDNYNIGSPIATGDENGLKGQCMDNPWSIFSNHVIVKYKDTYYDPSYGSDAVNDITIWQGNSIAYFGTAVSIRERDDLNGRFQQHYWLKAIDINEVVKLSPVAY